MKKKGKKKKINTKKYKELRRWSGYRSECRWLRIVQFVTGREQGLLPVIGLQFPLHTLHTLHTLYTPLHTHTLDPHISASVTCFTSFRLLFTWTQSTISIDPTNKSHQKAKIILVTFHRSVLMIQWIYCYYYYYYYYFFFFFFFFLFIINYSFFLYFWPGCLRFLKPLDVSMSYENRQNNANENSGRGTNELNWRHSQRFSARCKSSRKA